MSIVFALPLVAGKPYRAAIIVVHKHPLLLSSHHGYVSELLHHIPVVQSPWSYPCYCTIYLLLYGSTSAPPSTSPYKAPHQHNPPSTSPYNAPHHVLIFSPSNCPPILLRIFSSS
eukprot:TRINITY_DN11545_c0_g1_i1.p1 TRINITY_DN11545_c0_g1~~TRINITY_DN11545_c0_g1_i1.p1  ORF type:complete len:115 (-),score=0.99 TRINITY_DN11545_c0_g1_i1:599-943(-)